MTKGEMILVERLSILHNKSMVLKMDAEVERKATEPRKWLLDSIYTQIKENETEFDRIIKALTEPE